MPIPGKLANLKYFRNNYAKGIKLQHNEKKVEGLNTTIIEEELFIGSVFLSDVSNLDLSNDTYMEEHLIRMGFISTDN